MNIEIKEKYNNFVKIIENKEKLEWLKQTNQTNKNELNQTTQINKSFNDDKKSNLDDCSCNISSGYTSELSNKSNKLNKSIRKDNYIKSNTGSKSNSTNKKKYKKDVEKKSSNSNGELSLLEDDYFIGKKSLSNNINDLNDNSETDKSDEIKKPNKLNEPIISKTIDSEFQNIFLINDYSINKKIVKKNQSSEIKDKLENIYNKIIVKNPNQQNKLSGYKIENYIKQDELINQSTIDSIIKKLSIMLEYVFNESIRGWNQDHNLYIIQFDKLKQNLKKIIFNSNTQDLIKFGFIYRDFNEPKAFLSKDFTKYWVGYDIESLNSNKLNQTNYYMKDKMLFYCLKNLTKSYKFKKKISKWNYKFIKKTVQVYSHKNLLVDIILFVGIKINE
jgi:hypothetical protein